MSKLNMRLTSHDEKKISLLKERYGYKQTSELIRYLLTNSIESTSKKENLSS
jgi:hypothetical protein